MIFFTNMVGRVTTKYQEIKANPYIKDYEQVGVYVNFHIITGFPVKLSEGEHVYRCSMYLDNLEQELAKWKSIIQNDNWLFIKYGELSSPPGEFGPQTPQIRLNKYNVHLINR